MRKKSLLFVSLAIAAEIAAGVMAIIFCLSLLLILFHTVFGFFDQLIIDFIYSFRSDEMTQFMLFITSLGGGIFIISGIILLALLLYRKHKKSAFNFTFILIFGIILNLFLKYIFARPRPDYLPLLFEATYSFPSGHAMNSFIFYTCVVYFIWRNTNNKKVRFFTVAFFGMLIFLIGISRIYLGVHYPSDVVAGYIAGVLWFMLVLLVERTAVTFKLFKHFG